MRVFIADRKKTVSVHIYGVYGHEITREFFSLFFLRAVEVHETTDEERQIMGTDAEFTIETYDLFKAFADKIDDIQKAIDDISYLLIEGTQTTDYICDDRLYAI